MSDTVNADVRPSFTPEQEVAARAIDLLCCLSPRSLRELRTGHDRTYTSAVPRHVLRKLADAVDRAHPGWLDAAKQESAR